MFTCYNSIIKWETQRLQIKKTHVFGSMKENMKTWCRIQFDAVSQFNKCFHNIDYLMALISWPFYKNAKESPSCFLLLSPGSSQSENTREYFSHIFFDISFSLSFLSLCLNLEKPIEWIPSFRKVNTLQFKTFGTHVSNRLVLGCWLQAVEKTGGKYTIAVDCGIEITISSVESIITLNEIQFTSLVIS